MKDYLKNFINIFEKPKVSKNYNKTRSAHPLELFFDLIFVGAMAKLGHLLHEPDISSLIVIFVSYITIYQIWYNITIYNIYYFGTTYLIKFFLFLIMIPVVFIVGVKDISTIENILIISFSFSISRFAMAFMWLISMNKSDKDSQEHINRESIYHVVSYSLSGIIALIPFIKSDLFLISLIIALIIEYVIILIRNIDMKNSFYPHFNYELLKERQMLFLIIIWGEGIVLITNSLSNSNVPHRFIEGILLFIILFIYFIRTVEEYALSKYNKDNIHYFVISHFVFILFNLSLFISLSEITISDGINSVHRYIVMIVLLAITIWHLYNNRLFSKETSGNKDMNTYIKVDNTLLVLQLFIIPLLYIIENNIIFMMCVLIYFIFLIMSTPYRYKWIKQK